MNKSQFPLLADCTYLNTPSSGLLSMSLLAWRNQHDLKFHQEGSAFRENHVSFLENTKRILAEFYNADTSNTFLVPNFSFALNTIVDGLDLPQRFLLFKEDYPSISIPIERKGAVCHKVDADEFLEERILDAVRKFKPTIFAFSYVQYINGIKMDLAFIRKLKKDNPNLILIADGTQYCGTEIFDFKNSGIDVLISSGYKWMLAGYGNGFVFIKDAAIPYLFSNLSKNTKPAEMFLQGKSSLSFILEPGHQDTLVYGSLGQAVLAFKEMDYAVESLQLKQLSERAKRAFFERGLLEESIVKRKEHSSIFNIKGDDALYQRLLSKNIICNQRGRGIRVGYHFFNTEEDLKRILTVLDKK